MQMTVTAQGPHLSTMHRKGYIVLRIKIKTRLSKRKSVFIKRAQAVLTHTSK